jgi:hypothetical protein
MMLQRDGADALLTGTIFAAIFVILLIGLCRETYVVAGSSAAGETPAAALLLNSVRSGREWMESAFCAPGKPRGGPQPGDKSRWRRLADASVARDCAVQ